MRISELLTAIASWLENPDNEAITLAEYDDDCLKVVSESCVQAAAILKLAAEETDLLEPKEDSNITSENIEGLAAIATEFDESGDPRLQKQASLIDELLLTISASKDFLKNKRAAEDYREKDLKKKYEDAKKFQDKNINREELEKRIDKSEYMKDYSPMEFGLKSRYCPDHPGVSVIRLSDSAIQCPLDRKVYDYEIGFKLENGGKVPGGTVEEQTKLDTHQQSSAFFSREERMSENKA